MTDRPFARLWSLVLSAMLGVLPATAWGGETVRQQQGDWLLTCNNQAHCNITGINRQPTPSVPARAAVLLDRSSDADAKWRLRWHFVAAPTAPGQQPTKPLMLSVLGGNATRGDPVSGLVLAMLGTNSVGPGPSLPIGAPVPLAGYIEPDADAAALQITQLAAGYMGHVMSGDTAYATTPVGDLATLLAAADLHQQEARAEARAGQDDYWRWIDVFPVREVGSDQQSNLLPECIRAENMETGVVASNGERLWLIRCPDGNRLMLTDASGTHAIDIPDRLKWVIPQMLRVDEAGLLLLVEYHAPDRSCGVISRFGWTADGEFTLVEQSDLPLCRGLESPWWPISYTLEHTRFLLLN